MAELVAPYSPRAAVVACGSRAARPRVAVESTSGEATPGAWPGCWAPGNKDRTRTGHAMRDWFTQRV